MYNKQAKQKRKWQIGLGVALLLAVSILLMQARPSLAADSNWTAKYWNNVNLSGDPVLVRQENNIDYDWGNGSPADGVNRSDFSVRWKKTINFAEGTYRFDATVDDGMRIYVDDNLILNSWADSQVHSVSATVNLTSGDHTVKVEYYDAGGAAVAKLTITTVSTVIAQWRGEYFNNATLSGSPAFTRNDNQIDFNWGGGSPGSGVAADNFSVRWSRDISLDAGRYRFTTTTDDGVRLWVNNRLLIDKWIDQATTSYSAEIDLPGGTVPVRMEYYERVGGAEAHLSRTKISGGDTVTRWRGDYYNNKNLSGTPALVRDDAHIDFNWGNGSPASGISADNFSVRWTRTIYFSPGRYRFTANTDDGVRLWVNDQQIINAWSDRRAEDINAEINLPGGNAVVKMEYYENAGGARARLTRTQIGTVPAPMPIPVTAGTATINIYRLNVRQGPGTNFGIITTLNRGDVLPLAGYRNAAATWIKVVLPNGTQGWVSAIYTISTVPIVNLTVDNNPTPTTPAPTPVPTGATARVTAFYLNVRQGPAVTYPAIMTVGLNQVYALAGVRNSAGTWVKIVLTNGAQGWVNASYVATSVPVSSLPVGN